MQLLHLNDILLFCEITGCDIVKPAMSSHPRDTGEVPF